MQLLFANADTSVYEVKGLRLRDTAECVLARLLRVRVALPLTRMRKVLLAIVSDGKCVAVLILCEYSLNACGLSCVVFVIEVTSDLRCTYAT